MRNEIIFSGSCVFYSAVHNLWMVNLIIESDLENVIDTDSLLRQYQSLYFKLGHYTK